MKAFKNGDLAMPTEYEDTAREVLELEIQGLKQLLNKIDIVFSQIVEEILNITGRVIVSGMGKSGHIARKFASTLASTGTPAIFIHPAEAGHGDLGMITKNDIMILLSNSGETPELAPIIEYCKRFAIKIIGITRKVNSTLYKASTIPVVLPDAPEASDIMAPTTSTIMMMAYGDAVAVALHKKRNFSRSDYKIFHPGGNIGAKLLRVRDLMHTGEDVPLVSEQNSMLEAILTITSKRFGCVGVLNNEGKLTGVITDGDLRRHIDIDIRKAKAVEIMTHSPVVLNAEGIASEALGIMSKKSITNVFIIDENQRPQGILHIHDLLKAGVM
jgi:arabinose-5-phosphate isomerase